MSRVTKAIAWVGLLPLMLLVYSNCAQFSDNGMFNGSSLCPDQNCALVNGQLMSLKAQNQDLIMRCGEQFLAVGGICNAGSSSKNFIEYSLSKKGEPIVWGYGPQAVSVAKDAQCENGRFFVNVRRPSSPPDFTDRAEDYDLTLKLFFQDPETQAFELATEYTETIKIEHGGCPDPAVPPQAPPVSVSSQPLPPPVPFVYCKGVGTTPRELSAANAGQVSGNCPRRSGNFGPNAEQMVLDRWFYDSTGTAIVKFAPDENSLSTAIACPPGRKMFGGCAESTSCKIPNEACPRNTNPVKLKCHIECY
ncbi:MAG: hypothetical protein WCH11_02355 [Bdellovibrio sp.]